MVQAKTVPSAQACECSVIPSSGGEAESSKQSDAVITRRFASALFHSSAGRIFVKEHIPACSPGENRKECSSPAENSLHTEELYTGAIIRGLEIFTVLL